MKVIKIFEEFQSISEIDKLCRAYGFRNNYTINSDVSVDVDGDIYMSRYKFNKLPLKFNKVSGHFYCNENGLITLEGCPKEVGGSFGCTNNKLTSLEGGPKKVGGGFSCHTNNLMSLEWSPKEVGIQFDCCSNLLNSLEGCPSKIGGIFSCGGNPVYYVWKLIDDKEHLELFLDYDIIRDGNVIILDRLNDLLDLIGKPKVTGVYGYKCI